MAKHDRVFGSSRATYDPIVRFVVGKERRRYAAVEAEKLGHGGVQYVAELFACVPNTIRHGSHEIEKLPAGEAESRVRKKGRSKTS